MEKESFFLQIERQGNFGEGIGFVDGLTVFVEGALPGETCFVTWQEKKKHYAKAKLLKVETPSPDRTLPNCPLFSSCGGCQWMHLAYEKQLEAKTEKVKNALQRIGGFKEIHVPLCKASPKTLGYRNKIILPIVLEEKKIKIGFYEKNSHNVIDVDSCLIHHPMGDQIYQKIKNLLLKEKITPFDPKTKKGNLKHLLLKTSITKNEALIAFVTANEEVKYLSSFAEKIMQECPAVKGVMQNVKKEDNNAIFGPLWKTVSGQSYIEESLCDLHFSLSAPSFFQVNPLQAAFVYEHTLANLFLTGSETILDAYSGIGTLSLFAARKAKKVIGIECVENAVLDAKENAKRNQIENVEFHAGKVEDLIQDLQNIEIVILNPPRKGCEKSVLFSLKKIFPKKIVYVSCDPATLARDLSFLKEFGYEIILVQPFDMFPQTTHVETVVHLIRK